MRILFLSTFLPFPPRNGIKMRAWSLLRALAADSHETTLLTFAYPYEFENDLSTLQELCTDFEIIPLDLPRLSSTVNYYQRIRTLLSSLPYSAYRFASARMRKAICEKIETSKPDAIFCYTTFSAVNLPDTKLPILLDTVDVQHLILKRYTSFTPNPLKRIYALNESRLLRDYELRVCRLAKICTACSLYDKSIFMKLSQQLQINVIPNAVDIELYNPSNDDDGKTIIYVGGMDWHPNRDAVEYFASKVLPLIKKHFPSVIFLVAGRNPSDSFKRKFKRFPQIEFTGTLADVRPEIDKAAVFVVPLRIGSGTRIKILEAAAMEKAIVTTSLGTEGLDFEAGKELLVADRAPLLAQQIQYLLCNSEYRRELGKAARARVEAQYTFPVLRESFRQALSTFRQRSSAGEITPEVGKNTEVGFN